MSKEEITEVMIKLSELITKSVEINLEIAETYTKLAKALVSEQIIPSEPKGD